VFTVEEVGPLVKEKLWYELKKGDKVIKGQYSGDDIKIDGEENLTIVAAEYILAKVD
jgi:co-chaperonin GroES (HSP10)